MASRAFCQPAELMQSFRQLVLACSRYCCGLTCFMLALEHAEHLIFKQSAHLLQSQGEKSAVYSGTFCMF